MISLYILYLVLFPTTSYVIGWLYCKYIKKNFINYNNISLTILSLFILIFTLMPSYFYKTENIFVKTDTLKVCQFENGYYHYNIKWEKDDFVLLRTIDKNDTLTFIINSNNLDINLVSNDSLMQNIMIIRNIKNTIKSSFIKELNNKIDTTYFYLIKN